MAFDDNLSSGQNISTDNVTVRFENIALNDLSTNVSVSVKISNTDTLNSVHINYGMTYPQETNSFCTQDQDGDTNLHIAIIQQEPSLAINYIAMAPNSDCLNLCNSLLQTPLHLAVITRQGDIVRRLMVAGASVTARDVHGNMPIHIACKEGYEEIVECLLTPIRLEETAQNTFKAEFQNIPQDLSVKNYDGFTCVHLAAMTESLRSLDCLLTSGADINVGDGKSGRTALHNAVESGSRIMFHYLLMWKQTNINCVTYGGLSPLRLATGRGYTDIVEVLIGKGAELDTVEADD